MSAPEAAVEAAAEWLPHAADCEVRPERDCTCWQPRVDLMRAALEAAAPHMLEQAWESGWANARGNYLALHQGQEIPEWVTLRNPYRPTDQANHPEAVPTGAASSIPEGDQ